MSRFAIGGNRARLLFCTHLIFVLHHIASGESWLYIDRDFERAGRFEEIDPARQSP
jgi:hypothetical protein